MKTRPPILLGVLLAIPLVSGPVFGAAADGTGVMCVDLRRIDNTVVVDDQNILFYLRGDHIYRNQLRNPVPGLDRDQPFMYRTVTGQLCRNDSVTVLEQLGFGYMAGATGTLGEFVPIDKEQAQSLRRGDVSDKGVEAVTVK
ncbi:MAG: hypothetical protein ACWGPN_17095 [Gammaproteobacteria bacterium]